MSISPYKCQIIMKMKIFVLMVYNVMRLQREDQTTSWILLAAAVCTGQRISDTKPNIVILTQTW